LVDVTMPGMDGVELVRRVKSDPTLASTAIILMSAVDSTNDFRERVQGLDIGGCLMKPVPESSLYDSLIRVLEPAVLSVGQISASLPESAAQAPPAIGQLRLPADHKCRVLLAEDNPINQKVASLQLRKLGLEVDAVVNGVEAVEAALRVPYDVVLMDCQMPEMDGYEATREIRRREDMTRHTPIVAMTAHVLPGDRDKCLAAGMDDYISKPVTLKALESALSAVLAPKQPSAVAAEASAILSPTRNGGMSAFTTRESEPAPSKALAGDRTEDTARVVAPAPTPAITPAADGLATAICGDRADEICDRETINLLRQEGENLFRELIELFKTEMPKGLKDLAQALDHGDSADAAIIAHTLKGTAGAFGAKRMSELAAAIDQAARAGSIEKARSMLVEFRSECEKVGEVLATQLAQKIAT
jgi:two-component system, sensor histidine kinase and response regulator